MGNRRGFVDPFLIGYAVVVLLGFSGLVAHGAGLKLPKPRIERPKDCEPYNVGRVECGSKSGGNPRSSFYNEHRKKEGK